MFSRSHNAEITKKHVTRMLRKCVLESTNININETKERIFSEKNV